MQDYESHYKQSLEDPEHFWMEQAKTIDWFTPPKQAITKDEKGLFRWFKDGKLNTSYLALVTPFELYYILALLIHKKIYQMMIPPYIIIQIGGSR